MTRSLAKRFCQRVAFPVLASFSAGAFWSQNRLPCVGLRACGVLGCTLCMMGVSQNAHAILGDTHSMAVGYPFVGNAAGLTWHGLGVRWQLGR